MRRNLGSIAALVLGASLVWSCTGEIDPTDSDTFPSASGQKSGAGGAAGQPVSGAAAGHGGSSGNESKPTSGAAGQPVSGAAGQAGNASVAPPTTGAAGSDSVAPPTTGAAGAASTGTVAPPPTGAAGQAGNGSAGKPATGAAGSATVAPPTTGAAGAAGSAGVTPPPGGTTGTPSTTTAASTIVPLYTSPSDPSWNAVIAAKKEHPTVGVVAIVNPADGPGSSVDSGYTSGIARLTAAGIRVIGYVATGYGANSAASVKANVDRWKQFYPGLVTGIFFDEQSNKAEYVPYYRDLSQYTKAQGLSFTVGNPGTDTAESYVGALDMMLIYESSGLPSTSQMAGWHANHAPSNFGIIPYATSLDATFVKNARKYVQYIYLQSDNLPNPWDSVPSYFSSLLAALE